MNIKTLACSLIAVMFMMSCDSDTSSLGGSIIPSYDIVQISSDTCYATSRSIAIDDPLLMKTTVCTLGRYTDPLTSVSFNSGFLTQLNCVENFELPDSVYGIGNHVFPDWFIEKVGDADPYYANLRLYFSDFFGDSVNTVKIDIFLLDKMLDGNSRYYTDTDPNEYYDETAEPVASALVSPINFLDSDSLRSTSKYYPSLTFRLPDSIAVKILNAYYSDEGRKWFTSASSFMENLCKGFYVRCSQGDGSVFYIDKSVLEVNFKCIEYDKNGKESYKSYMAEFTGSEEVLQVSCIDWKGLDGILADNTHTWIKSPSGILTEISLPVDEMKEGGSSVLNSAKLIMSTVNTPPQSIKPSAPSILMLIRKGKAAEFFKGNNNVDDTESYVATYDGSHGTYTYGNIAEMVEKICSDRSEWLKKNGLEDNNAGRNAYEQANPDWNKAILVPVRTKKNASSQVLNYIVDTYMHQAKFAGGTDGKKINIYTVSSKQ
ncbi:MAG: DUF4270 domain-containing protein [Bacteroidaceae bacterium]|nr:DUF4270 domain-containing protein [Bacteroidaceae bacterium]